MICYQVNIVHHRDKLVCLVFETDGSGDVGILFFRHIGLPNCSWRSTHSNQTNQSSFLVDNQTDRVASISPLQSIVGTHSILLGMRVKDSWRSLQDKPLGRFGLSGVHDRTCSL